MTANSHRGSAKIIPFPSGDRAGFGARLTQTAPIAADDFAATRVAKATSAGAWYHEEAIRDAVRGRRH
jgi:hypothetical protein